MSEQQRFSRSQLQEWNSDPRVLQLYCSRLQLEQAGSRLEGCCPFHAEKTPHLSITEASSGEYLWRCAGACNESGDICSFIQKLDDVTFSEAVRTVREFLRGSGSKTAWNSLDPRPGAGTLAPQSGYKSYSLLEYRRFEEALRESKEAQMWLLSRGIELTTAETYHIGFRRRLKIAGKDDPDLVEAGWLVFPALDGDTIVSIKYLSLVRKIYYRQPNMQNALFGIHTLLRSKPVMVVGREIDALTLHQAEYPAYRFRWLSIRPRLK